MGYDHTDTTVLVSAMLKTDSVPGQVAAETLNGDIIPVLNDEIIAEYEDVLNRPKETLINPRTPSAA